MGQPRDTVYRVVATPADFRQCHTVLRANGHTDAEQLQKPAVMAMRAGQCLGFTSSRFRHGQLTLGRVQILPGKHAPWTAYRLFEAYENLLRIYGVTSYLVGVEADNPYLQYFVKTGLTEPPNAKLIQDLGTFYWYQRFL